MAVFGTKRSRPTHWLKTGLVQARRVGRVQNAEHGIGSGFLIDGSVIGNEFNGLPLFLTCRHVIGFAQPALDISRTSMVFEGMYEDASPQVTARGCQILCDSPEDQLNYALLLLDRWPGSIPDTLIAPSAPKYGNKVFVVSYPLGEGLAITLDDNDIVERDKASKYDVGPDLSHRVFYHAPTEPGSSGGPVFNENWEIVALHMGRGKSTNYGVALKDILTDVTNKLSNIIISESLAHSIRSAKTSSGSDGEDEPDYFSVFISYSHADSIFANRLYNSLHARGIRTWLDVKQMLPGDDIYTEVQRGIQSWDKVLLCCSESSLTSWWVDSEVDRAFQKERELFHARKNKVLALIPIMLDGFLLSGWSSGKAQEVRTRIAADFRGWEDEKKFESTLENLIQALRADGGSREALPKPKL
jgi:hypothetical protein